MRSASSYSGQNSKGCKEFTMVHGVINSSTGQPYHDLGDFSGYHSGGRGGGQIQFAYAMPPASTEISKLS